MSILTRKTDWNGNAVDEGYRWMRHWVHGHLLDYHQTNTQSDQIPQHCRRCTGVLLVFLAMHDTWASQLITFCGCILFSSSDYIQPFSSAWHWQHMKQLQFAFVVQRRLWKRGCVICGFIVFGVDQILLHELKWSACKVKREYWHSLIINRFENIL